MATQSIGFRYALLSLFCLQQLRVFLHPSHELVCIVLVASALSRVGRIAHSTNGLTFHFFRKFSYFYQVNDEHHRCQRASNYPYHEVYQVVEVRSWVHLLCYLLLLGDVQ